MTTTCAPNHTGAIIAAATVAAAAAAVVSTSVGSSRGHNRQIKEKAAVYMGAIGQIELLQSSTHGRHQRAHASGCDVTAFRQVDYFEPGKRQA